MTTLTSIAQFGLRDPACWGETACGKTFDMILPRSA